MCPRGMRWRQVEWRANPRDKKEASSAETIPTGYHFPPGSPGDPDSLLRHNTCPGRSPDFDPGIVQGSKHRRPLTPPFPPKPRRRDPPPRPGRRRPVLRLLNQQQLLCPWGYSLPSRYWIPPRYSQNCLIPNWRASAIIPRNWPGRLPGLARHPGKNRPSSSGVSKTRPWQESFSPGSYLVQGRSAKKLPTASGQRSQSSTLGR